MLIQEIRHVLSGRLLEDPQLELGYHGMMMEIGLHVSPEDPEVCQASAVDQRIIPDPVPARGVTSGFV